MNQKTKNKISQSIKGRHAGKNNPFYGKKHTEETKAKLRIARKGRTPALGMKHSKEWKDMISRINKGNKNHFGIYHSDEVKKQISESCKKSGCGLNNLGRRASIKTRLKLSKIKRREKNNNWQGGKTKLNLSIRKCFEYKIWRESIFERDNYTCIICNDSSGGNLQADHIKPFSVIIKENNITSIESAIKCQELWDLSNGRTLCVNCHKQTDTYLEKALNYPININNIKVCQ